MAKTGSTCSNIATELCQIKLGGSLASSNATNPEGPYLLMSKKVTAAADWTAAGTTGQIELLANSDIPSGYSATCLSLVIQFTGTALTQSSSGSVAVYENGNINRSILSLAKANSTGFKTFGAANVNTGTAGLTLAAGKGASIGMTSSTTEASWVAEVSTNGQIVTILSAWLIAPA